MMAPFYLVPNPRNTHLGRGRGILRSSPRKAPKIRCLGYVLSYSVGYKRKAQKGAGAFSEQRKERNKRYAVRGGGGVGVDHSRLGGIRDVPAGSALAVRRRP